MENNTILIDRYLQKELTTEERIKFEKQLAADKNLQEELRIQQLLVTAATDTAIKSEFAKAFNKKAAIQKVIRWTVAGVVIVGALIFLAIRMGLLPKTEHQAESFKRGTAPAEYFEFDNTKDTVIETKDGVVFAIPAGAFKGGRNIRLEVQTALTPYDIMEKELSTVSNGALLQTAGMFYINGYENEKPVRLVKDVAVSVPAISRNPNMQLFDGVDDGKGGINWVDPKPVDKSLLTYEITSLDFYPVDYIPVLKAWKKEFNNKRYTDSLYYSFSGYPYDRNNDTAVADIMNFETISADIGAEADYNNDGDGGEADYQRPSQADTISRIKTPLPGTFQPDTVAPAGDSIRKDHEKKDTGKTHFNVITDTTDFKGRFVFKIDPGKIKAIWNEKFNNTILATKEFEERLRFMHGISNGESADFLSIYVNNLDKPLYVSDELCADAAKDEHNKADFLEFAARKDGSVKVAEGIQKQLSDYFQKRSAAYREAARKTWEKYESELSKLKIAAETRKTEQAQKELKRVEKLFDEEYCLNLTDAYRQIGVRRVCNDTVPVQPLPPVTYDVIITTTGWKNLDVYVYEATTTRENMNYTDPVTGKTAALTYSPLTIHVDNQSSYERVMVYIIPDSLSSFQRVEQQGPAFKESLNSLLRYDLVITGYRATEISYYRQKLIKPGEYRFNLSPTTKEALRGLLKDYDEIKAINIKQELEYQLAEQEELKRRIQVRNDYMFSEDVIDAIFCCVRRK